MIMIQVLFRSVDETRLVGRSVPRQSHHNIVPCVTLHWSIFVFFRPPPFPRAQGHMRFVGELYKVELLKERHVHAVRKKEITSVA